MEIQKKAIRLGAVAVGVCSIESLIRTNSVVLDVMPAAKSVVAIACSHSRAALDSKNLQVKQNDTMATYEKVRTVSKELAMTLEGQGHSALAIPPFLPMDMSDGKYGMVGSVDLKKAAVEAGIGSYGKSGLVLVKGFGPRVRLGAVLTSAPLKPTKKRSGFLCPEECRICLSGCPGKALPGEGKVDKRACGRVILQFGLRGMIKFVGEMIEASAERKAELLKSYPFRELWQTLASGNYYFCFVCQALCPVGKNARTHG
ncbi:MAG: epoxyqueuosine reductase [Deltaproteobacteria bacterium]|nr:epoxyqueuosine reductase [Deltaproteobacteria bacterium]